MKNCNVISFCILNNTSPKISLHYLRELKPCRTYVVVDTLLAFMALMVKRQTTAKLVMLYNLSRGASSVTLVCRIRSQEMGSSYQTYRHKLI